MSPEADPHWQTIYDRTCESYHAVDDMRMKLLGLLPIATGGGVFLLLSGKADLLTADSTKQGRVPEALGAIGVFGLLFTLGLFSYELFGIKKCHYLIESGKQLELQVELRGQFTSRPHAIAGRINEPFASAIIYPACMAAWTFLGLIFPLGVAFAAAAAGAVAVAGCAGTLVGAGLIVVHQERDDLVLEILGRRGAKAFDDLRAELGVEHNELERTLRRLVKQQDVVLGGQEVEIRARSGRLGQGADEVGPPTAKDPSR